MAPQTPKLDPVNTSVSENGINTGLSPLEPISSGEQSLFLTSPAFAVTRRSSFSSLEINSPEIGPTTAELQDIELQEIVSDEKTNVRVSLRPDPFAELQCAWGFSGNIDTNEPIPNTKTEFVHAVQSEKTAAGWVQDSLRSYLRAIHSGDHHTFKKDFLESQEVAAEITIQQLDAIRQHLDEVIEEVKDPNSHGETVHEALKTAFGHARPWIKRTRQISVSNHVFYKINYVLCPKTDDVVATP